MDAPLSISTMPQTQTPTYTRGHGPVVVISFEGNIGGGKSTILRRLKEKYHDRKDLVFVDEPVDAWDEAGLLGAMYDKRLHAASFQLMALMTRAGRIQVALQDPNVRFIITERSPWSDRYVFAEANLAGVELDNYKFTFGELMPAAFPFQMALHFVMLGLPTATALERTRTRNRTSEHIDESNGVQIEYLELLQEKHTSFIERMGVDHTTHTLDATNDKKTVNDDAIRIVDGIIQSCVSPACVIPHADSYGSVGSASSAGSISRVDA